MECTNAWGVPPIALIARGEKVPPMTFLTKSGVARGDIVIVEMGGTPVVGNPDEAHARLASRMEISVDHRIHVLGKGARRPGLILRLVAGPHLTAPRNGSASASRIRRGSGSRLASFLLQPGGLNPVGLTLVTKGVITARHPVGYVVDPTSQQIARPTTHPLPPPCSVEHS